MAKIVTVLGCVLLLSISSLVIAQVVFESGGPQPAQSVVLRDCDDIKDCGADSKLFSVQRVSDSTSLIVVYLYDVTDLPIARQTVMAVIDNGGPNGRETAASVQTDRAGMASLSVTPGKAYTIQVADVGWAPLKTEAKVAVKGGVRLLRVLMKVPPIA